MSDAARLLRLLSLLQTSREWPGSELADRLGVTSRTVRRDVDRLRDLGYPVEASMGALGGYRLVAGTAMPPLLLDDEETVAVAVGLRTAARQPVAGIAEASLRALAKLQQVLPPRLARRVSSLTSATATSAASFAALVDPAQLAVIAAAVSARERVRFAYVTNENVVAKRHVEPVRLVALGRRWYLLAHDVDRDDWRIFRLDRISSALATGTRFPPRVPPGGDATEYVTQKMYDTAPTYRARATLRLPVELARARLADFVGDLTALDDGSCSWHSVEDTIEYLAFRLTLLGCEFTVHGPVELVDHLRELGQRIGRSVG
ncbi:Predicted DNA-binding transcriptional regulator YafY, contains an HTH and WYL domains [Lentzea xinjiangensis]|uniref:Predicted DNA-binding transcriptional regulator YafY, contains an HTH and WYL domains n=1 Tax=Lentzea xinjiangensis TaxID=402600 RepID=A0A1H9MJI1_9PSEU|nr:WYL domain-containing protein [Lentzea xinjiangensis]SER23605.1 Predicted DNA-binding transcriptional regulator YafY, contains an HTH and WYL domains [Lentzea xinjiangensis]